MARKKKHNNKQEVLLCWSFPRRGWYKLNVDGSYRSGSRSIGGGGVIRNQDGEWLCGFAENLGTGKKPIEAELWALYRGLELVWNSGWTPVEVEMDSAMAVNLVCKPVELHNHSQFKLIRNYQQLIRNCQNLLTQIWTYSVQHVYRQKNSVADSLATFGLTLEPGCHYFDAPPPGCEAVLVQDICRVAQPRFLAPAVIEYRRVKKLEELNTHQEKAASATFTWKIDNFSKLDAAKHYSDAFVIGCFEWRILVYPRGNNSVGYLSLYLDVTGSSTLPKGWARHVRFSLTVVNQLQSSKSITNGTNWSLLEDVALCTSWFDVTHNSITGNEMQLREMWSLIHGKYLEQMGGKRTKESMSSRWKILAHSFTTWRDALAQASNNVRSGANYADEQLQAQAWYAAKIKSRNKSFNRWECWNIVKESPKFKVVLVGPEVHMNSTPLHSTPLHSTPPHSTPDHGFHVDEEDGEDVPETPIPEQASGSTRYPIRPLGKKASKRKGNASKNDYGKYMQELARQGEMSVARELAKYEADKARDEAKAAVIEQAFQAQQRERELLRQERELAREERMAQRDRDIMNTRCEGMSPDSKYFWKSQKADVVQRMRAREARSRQDGPSTTRQDDPTTTNWLSDGE